MTSLEALGLRPEIRDAFSPYAAQGLDLARVTLSIRDEYRLLFESGEWRGEPSGALLYSAERQADLPAAGDWVAARRADDDLAIVHAVLPRRTCFSRRAAGSREDEQLIAANIDTVLVVCGLDHDYNLRRLERYLTLAHASGARPVIVLNKTDLCGNVGERHAEASAIAAGAPVVAISAAHPDCTAALAPWLGPGLTLALLGSSGAGKSTLVNRLLGRERQLTAEVRESDSRGRHTTTHRELVPLPQGGALIDNPGMRELQMWAGEESLDAAFEDISSLAAACRFSDCSHAAEPGCAVRAALERGDLDPARWASFEKLRAEVRYHEIRADHNAAAAQKQRWKAIHKAMRAYKIRPE